MKNINKLVQNLLSCGSCDLKYIDELYDDFNVEPSIYDLIYNIGRDNIDANVVINHIFTTAVENAIEEAGIDMNDYLDEIYDIYINSLDSHLYVLDPEDKSNSTEVHNYNELLETLTLNFGSKEE